MHHIHSDHTSLIKARCLVRRTSGISARRTVDGVRRGAAL